MKENRLRTVLRCVFHGMEHVTDGERRRFRDEISGGRVDGNDGANYSVR